MKKLLMFLSLSLVLFQTACRKEAVSLNTFEQSILENSVYSGISQLQPDKEAVLLKNNSIRAVSYIKEYSDSAGIDSLTYLRFNKEGKIIQRTTDEITTVGCLPQTIVQMFTYENGRIKRVENYTFKYKTGSVIDKWMETDTSRLNLFDWEDYSYSGDTIVVESGYAVWKFIKDKKGNLTKRLLTVKSNNQIADVSYMSTPSGVKLQVKNFKDQSSPKDYAEFEVEQNRVKLKPLLADDLVRTENVYDDKGLLIEKIHYKNNKIRARTKIKYYYFQ